FLASLLHNLPQPVLAAVVLVAILGLINVPALKRLYALARTEFFIAIAATAGVLSSGMLRGVMIGAVMSLLLLIRRASSPYVAFLGRIPGTQRFSDMARHPDNEPVEGILIFRAESSLLYFNAEHVRDVVLEEFHRTHPRLVLCDLSSSPIVDLHACETLAELARELAGEGARLRLVEPRSSVRDSLRLAGLEELVGSINRFTTVAEAVEEFHQAPGAQQEPGSKPAAQEPAS
ncbi:SulP family inorganic anion transporter, partial [bacterium CPR1]|nr:SulP family inorganic anion transporter [bacterium CPR1]